MDHAFPNFDAAKKAVANGTARTIGNVRPPTGKAEDESGEPPDLQIVNPADLASRPVPIREWIVEDWLPIGCVTANYGDGGVGKTLLAHQLMTSTAMGKPWCGLDVMHCRSLALFCEDDQAELHRRQAAICAGYGVSMADLEPMRWVSGVGQDNTLMAFDPAGGERVTRLYHAIRKAGLAHGARLLVLDTAADLFAGNENDRHQVRRFIGQLNALAIEINGAVLLNAHPSRSGMASGNQDGGSTAWSNSVRSRWSLARPAADGGAEPDVNERILTRRKANYASVGDDIKLRWNEGVLISTTTVWATAADRAEAERVFMTLLDRFTKEDRRVTNSPNAGNFAPREFAKDPGRNGFKRKDFEIAMATLFATGLIRMKEYGRSGDARQQIARVTVP